MKPIYKLAAFAVLLNDCEVLNDCDSMKYQNRLREMAERQIREYPEEDSTYKIGVDFMTNEPRFRLIDGQKPDERTINVFLDLEAQLQEE